VVVLAGYVGNLQIDACPSFVETDMDHVKGAVSKHKMSLLPEIYQILDSNSCCEKKKSHISLTAQGSVNTQKSIRGTACSCSADQKSSHFEIYSSHQSF